MSALYAAGESGWRSAGLTEAQRQALRQRDEAGIAADLAWLAGPNRHLLSLDDPRYPAQLRTVAGAPPVLFVQGDPDWLLRPQLAIVGSRQATPQGLENAQAFAAALAARGFVITSGLALGIDGAAHRGALKADGATIAVCATGLDRVYPARHKALAHEIAAQGALVSEFPSGVPPLAEHFPRRNRILSGLSLGVLVVEAAPESGSLITARLALEQGREVFAIPGSIHNPMARGCHQLIRQGAKLTETVDDLLVELGPLLPGHPGRRVVDPSSAGAPASGLEAAVLAALAGGEILPLEQLAMRVSAPLADLQAALTTLELSGQVAVAAGGGIQRCH